MRMTAWAATAAAALGILAIGSVAAGALAAGSVALGGLVVNCMAAGVQDSHQETETHEFAVGAAPEVDLATFDGSITVQGWDRPEVRVVVEKRAGRADRMEAIEVDAGQTGGAVRVEARRLDSIWSRDRWSRDGWVAASLTVSMPRDGVLTARTGDGQVSLDGIAGTIVATTGDGAVRGERLRGSVRVRTGDGQVQLRDVAGAVEVATGDGAITVSGALEAVDLRSGDGAIEVEAAPDSGMIDDWAIRSGDGRVTLRLPRDFAADLALRTGDGRIRVDDPFGGDADRNANRLDRSIGGGGFTLRARTGDGAIDVQAR